jgi:hypothetical protein
MTDTATETPERTLTLAQIVFEQGEDALLAAIAQGGTTGSIEDKLAEGLSSRLRTIVLDEIVVVMRRVLGVAVVDLLGAAWRKWEPLAAAARRSLETPGSTEIVELLDHRITSSHQPGVDIAVDGVKIAEIRLDVEIAIEIHGLTAVVTDGRLSALRTGRGEASLNVSVDGTPLPPLTRPFDLAMELDLGEGLLLIPDGVEEVSLPPAPADQPITPAS